MHRLHDFYGNGWWLLVHRALVPFSASTSGQGEAMGRSRAVALLFPVAMLSRTVAIETSIDGARWRSDGPSSCSIEERPRLSPMRVVSSALFRHSGSSSMHLRQQLLAKSSQLLPEIVLHV